MKFSNPFVPTVQETPEQEPVNDMPSRRDDDDQPSFDHEEPTHNWWRNYLDWWNTVAFLINTIITYGVGSLGWLGTGINNAELSEKYQSLVTPNSTAFGIWAVIFSTEGLFTILQWFGPYRSKAQTHVRHYFIAACLFQAAWTIAFAYEVFWLSLIWMIAIWISLLGIVWRQQNLSVADVWWLGFPFQLHFSWITAAAALNVNVLFIDLGASTATQLTMAILTLSILFMTLIWSLFGVSNRSYTLASVMAWATWWIFAELQSPKPLIVETFSPDTIEGVAHASLSISITAIVVTAVVVVAAAMKALVRYDEEVTLAGSTIVLSTDGDTGVHQSSPLTTTSNETCGAAG